MIRRAVPGEHGYFGGRACPADVERRGETVQAGHHGFEKNQGRWLRLAEPGPFPSSHNKFPRAGGIPAAAPRFAGKCPPRSLQKANTLGPHVCSGLTPPAPRRRPASLRFRGNTSKSASQREQRSRQVVL